MGKEVQPAAEEARLVNKNIHDPYVLETIWRWWPTRTCAIRPGMREDEPAQCVSIPRCCEFGIKDGETALIDGGRDRHV